MIHVFPRIAFKADDKAGQHQGVSPDRILPTGFIRVRELGRTGKSHLTVVLEGIFVERAAILSSMLDRVEDHLQERAILFVRENGKPLVDAIAELKVIVPQARPTLELAQELDDGVDMPRSEDVV